jgi:hypothetical protein
MICLGYIGVEAFDIILYIGKTLSMLDYPVLIIDLTDTEALTKSIYHGMELDSTENITHYRGISYIRKIPPRKDLSDFDNGVVFVVYGLDITWKHTIQLDYLNIVIDSFPNNIDRVKRAISDVPTDNIRLRLLVKDIVTIDDFDRVKASFVSEIMPISSKYIYYDINDYENAIRCQVFQSIRFKGISKKMNKFIRSEIADILPGTKPSQINRAVCLARKGDRNR